MAFCVCPTIKIPLDYNSYPSSGEFTFSMILIWPSDMLAMPPSFEIADWKNKPSMCPLKTLKETRAKEGPFGKKFILHGNLLHIPMQQVSCDNNGL